MFTFPIIRLRNDRPTMRREQSPRRRPLVEGLEGRQLLSGVTSISITKSTPAIVGAHIGTGVTDIVGQHIGTGVTEIVGAHIGTNFSQIQGGHIGTNFSQIQGGHIGTNVS